MSTVTSVLGVAVGTDESGPLLKQFVVHSSQFVVPRSRGARDRGTGGQFVVHGSQFVVPRSPSARDRGQPGDSPVQVREQYSARSETQFIRFGGMVGYSDLTQHKVLKGNRRSLHFVRAADSGRDDSVGGGDARLI